MFMLGVQNTTDKFETQEKTLTWIQREVRNHICVLVGATAHLGTEHQHRLSDSPWEF